MSICNHYSIYRITNLINKKVYIGQTTQDSLKRWCDHLYAHDKNINSRNDKIPLYMAMRKYNFKNFKFEPIYSCFDIDELNRAETYFIEEHKSNDPKFGYNCDNGGNNKLINEETRQRMSISASNRTKNRPRGKKHWNYGGVGTMLDRKHTHIARANLLANQPDRSGKNNSAFDPTVYHWKNIDGREEFCSGYDLRMKYNLRIQSVSDLKHKRKKKLSSGWFVIFD